MFKEYKGLDLVAAGAEILDKWKKEDAFGQSLRIREGAPEFIFFEGPPSANGMPGIHHVMARSIKDAICRYKTQTGYKVARKAGWDTHGLPVELGVEKKLGITKADIGEKISVEEYNATCRKEVMKYTKEWVNLTERIGYWVDMDNPYVTYENEYIETLWYLLKKIYDKGLLYKGFTIQPFSPTDGTGLSSHELNQPGCYRDVTDTTATVQFEVIKDGTSQPLFGTESLPVYILAWTTTPWTLPSNTALCVGPEIDYIRVMSFNPYTGDPAIYIIAKALLDSMFNPKGAEVPLDSYVKGDKVVPYKVLDGCFKGKELLGIRYHQLIPWFKPEGDAFRVIPGDYVSTEDGTGIVHIAPTFGADDKRVAAAAGIAGIMPLDKFGNREAQVDRQGRFCRLEDLDAQYAESIDPTYKEWAGRYVKNQIEDYFRELHHEEKLPADRPTLDVDLCMMMKADGRAFKIQKHTHSYPHSWRTDAPVIYYPLDSWFIKASAVKEEMIALNKQITWKPASTGTGRFGQWLENIQDWNLSRSRYWGTPLPIWRTEDGKEEICIGSVEELRQEVDKAVKAGIMKENPLNVEQIDLHRPYVDNIFLVSPSGKKMTRETDLIDVWFDSGAMPYAQEGLKNLDTKGFGATADFIAEGVDQTRGWFYTLHAIHTMISGTPAFRRVISNGLVLDKDGNKMSKRLGNAVDPFYALDKYGADSLRWYMLTNAQPWDNLRFDEAGVDEVRRKFFGTLFNTYKLFAQYANIDGFNPGATKTVPVKDRPEIDRWIISKLNSLVGDVRAAYEDYDITTAGRLIQDFVCDELSNWYVRLNRKRFWGSEKNADKDAAYQTLHEVLVKVAMLGAPIAPFYMDRLYMDLTGKETSVHLELMPEASTDAVDKDLEERMAAAQKACSLVHSLRKLNHLNVRQPLGKVVIPVISEKIREQLSGVRDLVLSEVNVKEMEFIADTAGIITLKIKPNFKTLGKIYGPQMKEIAAAFGGFSQADIAAIQKADAAAEPYTVSLPGGDVVLNPGDYQISSEDMPGWAVATEGQLTVALDITLTDELRSEGVAREIVNRIQNVRKDSGFEVTDRVKVTIYANGNDFFEIASAIDAYYDYVTSQTLSQIDSVSEDEAPGQAMKVEWNDGEIAIEITK